MVWQALRLHRPEPQVGFDSIPSRRSHHASGNSRGASAVLHSVCHLTASWRE